MMVESAEEKDVKITDRHASVLNLLMLMSQLPELPMQILAIHKHQEDLQNGSFVLKATRHFDLAQKYA